MKIKVSSFSPKETEKIGKIIGEILPEGTVLLLEGELGCGKTCLTRGIVAGRGFNREEVSSPSFTIVQEYGDVVHIDFYRLQDEEEALSVGVEDYLLERDRIKVVEWPQVIADFIDSLQFPVLKITCFYSSDGRIFEIEGDNEILKHLKINLLDGGFDVKDS